LKNLWHFFICFMGIQTYQYLSVRSKKDTSRVLNASFQQWFLTNSFYDIRWTILNFTYSNLTFLLKNMFIFNPTFYTTLLFEKKNENEIQKILCFHPTSLFIKKKSFSLQLLLMKKKRYTELKKKKCNPLLTFYFFPFYPKVYLSKIYFQNTKKKSFWTQKNL